MEDRHVGGKHRIYIIKSDENVRYVIQPTKSKTSYDRSIQDASRQFRDEQII